MNFTIIVSLLYNLLYLREAHAPTVGVGGKLRASPYVHVKTKTPPEKYQEGVKFILAHKVSFSFGGKCYSHFRSLPSALKSFPFSQAGTL
jgi:hypothetical protein